MTEFLLVAAWGMLVLASFDGWGRVAAGLAGRPTVDRGLRMAWGMAVVLAIGGVLNALDLATRPVVMTVVVAGVLLAAPGWREKSSWRGIPVMGWIAALILFAHYLGQIGGIGGVCYDDPVAYLGFVERQLALGAVDEPFSMRRLGSHGGQTFLQSLVVAAGQPGNTFLVDGGIAPIAIYLLIRGALPGRGSAMPALTLLLTLLTLLHPFNSQSQCTGTVMFLGLSRTLIGLGRPGDARPRELVLVGLLAAAAACLRANFLAGAVLLPGLWLVSGWSQAGRSPLRALWRTALPAGVGLAFLAPWMAALWRSSGTPLYPIFPGTSANGFNAFHFSATFAERASDYAVSTSGILLLLPLLALWRATPERRVLICAHAAAVTVALVLCWRLSDSNTFDIERYMWPMVAVPILLASIVAVHAAPMHRLTMPIVVALCAGTVFCYEQTLIYDAAAFVRAIDPDRSVEESRLAHVHRTLQDLVPAGETLLLATEHPYSIDYRRNKALNLDYPGGASPAPGMPFFQGPEPVRHYLLGLGVHYVLFVDGTQKQGCLYDRAHYSEAEYRKHPPAWRIVGSYTADTIDTLNRLATTSTVLGREDNHVLIRLDER